MHFRDQCMVTVSLGGNPSNPDLLFISFRLLPLRNFIHEDSTVANTRPNGVDKYESVPLVTTIIQEASMTLCLAAFQLTSQYKCWMCVSAMVNIART